METSKNIEELLKEKDEIYNELLKLLKTKKKILAETNINSDIDTDIIDNKFKNLKD
jgi:hypothetical protein